MGLKHLSREGGDMGCLGMGLLMLQGKGGGIQRTGEWGKRLNMI